MVEISTSGGQQLAKTSEEAMGQLGSIFEAYNSTAARMRESYDHMQAEVERLRHELRKKNEQLERKSRLAALGQMAAGMAHEIRNPLGAVQLYTSLLERDLQRQAVPLQWVNKIGNGVRSLNTIVTDMLAFTQDQKCEKTSINFVGLLSETIDYVKPGVKTSTVEIDVEHVDKSLIVQVDVNMMRRVLLNLLLNAIEAVGGDGIVSVMAGSVKNNEAHSAYISVADNGAGIKSAVMKEIFNPFFTTKDTGTGLGLAIVHRLVECHGGVITAANGENGGAVFTILLP